MKPARFIYEAPEELADALDLLSEYGDEARVLAGGQSLVPMLALRLAAFPRLIDLNRVQALSSVSRNDGQLMIGSMTRQTDVMENPLFVHAPLLQQATPLIGHFQIRNRGTVGGSIAHADPAAEYPAVALALGAELILASKGGTRTIAASEFFTGDWSTLLAPDELLVEIRLPIRRTRTGSSIVEVARRRGDFALVGVACSLSLAEDDTVSEGTVAAFGVGSQATLLSSVRDELIGASAGNIDTEALGRRASEDVRPRSDVHASSTYRKDVLASLTARAIQDALEEAVNSAE